MRGHIGIEGISKEYLLVAYSQVVFKVVCIARKLYRKRLLIDTLKYFFAVDYPNSIID
jgi:hypothetical protein